MAVEKNISKSVLTLKEQTGTLVGGKPRYKSYNYTIDQAATDEAVLACADALAKLFAPTIVQVLRCDDSNLVNA